MTREGTPYFTTRWFTTLLKVCLKVRSKNNSQFYLRALLFPGPSQIIRGSRVTLGFQKGNDLIVCRWKECFRKYVGLDHVSKIMRISHNYYQTIFNQENGPQYQLGQVCTFSGTQKSTSICRHGGLCLGHWRGGWQEK